MRRRMVAGLLAVAVAASWGVQPAAATDNSLLFGQKQAYSAVVRTDGKVVTYAKIILNNPEEKALATTSFTVPSGVKVANMSVYQILSSEKCGTRPPSSEDEPTAGIRYVPSCAEMEDQLFSLNSYYYWGTDKLPPRYKEVATEQSGDTYRLTLPEPIKAQKRGAYLVSYIAEQGYVSNTLGLFSLHFKTLKVPQMVEEVRVAVDVAQDLHVRDKNTSVSANMMEQISVSSGANAADASVTNRSLDQLQGAIGTGGSFTKTGKSLMAGETFVVNGEFADSRWKLYFWPIVGLIAGGAITLGLIVLLLRKAEATAGAKKSNRNEKDEGEKDERQ